MKSLKNDILGVIKSVLVIDESQKNKTDIVAAEKVIEKLKDVFAKYGKWLNENYSIDALEPFTVEDFTKEETYKKLFDWWLINVYETQ